MRAGTLDRRITLQVRTDTMNAVGQPIPAWADWVVNLPAAYEPARGREYFAAQALTVTEPARFRIRYLTGVVPGMRISYDGKIWDVAAVEEMYGRENEMHLYAETGLTEG